MGFRFRKAIKLAPGVRLNFGLRGVSLTAGPRGASVNIGRRGVYGNVGIPGTGLHYREKIGDVPKRQRTPALSDTGEMAVRLSLQDDGKVNILDDEGNPLPPRHVKIFREQHEEQIAKWLKEKCDLWNQGIDSILNLHLQTPPPQANRTFIEQPFESDPPDPPSPRSPRSAGFWGRIFKRHRELLCFALFF